MSINNSQQLLDNAQQLFLYVNSECFTSTVNASCQQLLVYVNRGCGLPPSGKDTESTKHDPLKLVTILHESQDVYPFLRTIM